ncbi:MAG: GIY-YIG nuclease family protein [Parcubacteria group bacterium]|nr:GIY-YIG nuclease family protein [Parcubacteria group bacterium]
MKYFVYILFSEEDKKFYIGFTSDLERRICEHLNKKVKSTSTRELLHLIFYEAYASDEDARRRERYLKTTKGRRTLQKMLESSLKYGMRLQ